MKITRAWGMPVADTFDCEPIKGFVQSYLMKSKISVDPFARNKRWATYTNDLNPSTAAQYHHEACDFLSMLCKMDVKCDLAIFDPPYSPRQVKECYDEIGRKMVSEDAMSGNFRKRVYDAAKPLLCPGAIALSFGWNSCGLGKNRGFEMIEVLIVCHGSSHNDTICVAERLTDRSVPMLF